MRCCFLLCRFCSTNRSSPYHQQHSHGSISLTYGAGDELWLLLQLRMSGDEFHAGEGSQQTSGVLSGHKASSFNKGVSWNRKCMYKDTTCWLLLSRKEISRTVCVWALPLRQYLLLYMCTLGDSTSWQWAIDYKDVELHCLWQDWLQNADQLVV